MNARMECIAAITLHCKKNRGVPPLVLPVDDEVWMGLVSDDVASRDGDSASVGGCLVIRQHRIAAVLTPQAAEEMVR